LEPTFQSTSFKAEEGGILRTTTGSIIKVPENAFLDSLGNQVSGEVNLYFREFSSAEGVFLSGIPMEVSMGKNDSVLSTASMWEIRADQNGKALELDSVNQKTISTTIASNIDGEEYDFWQFDEEKGQWTNIAAVNPESNPEVELLNAANTKSTTAFNKMNLDNNFIMNYYGLLDVFQKPDNVLQYYKGYFNQDERTQYIKKIKSRAENFPLQWVGTHNDEANVVYYGKELPASLMVWEAETKVPAKVKRIKDGRYKIEYVGRHRYRISFYNDKNRNIHPLIAKIKMPVRDLYRVGKDNWLAQQAQYRQEMEEQEARLATLGTVMRTMEIAQLGIYNYDKILFKPESLPVMASIHLDENNNVKKEELVVYCYLENSRSVLRYYPQDLENFVLYPEANYKVFCITGPGQLAYLPNDKLKELVERIPQLEKLSEPQVDLYFKTYGSSIESVEDFQQFITSDSEYELISTL